MTQKFFSKNKFFLLQSSFLSIYLHKSTQKINFFVKNFFSKCEHIRKKLRIHSHLLNKSLTEKFIFYVVNNTGFTTESCKFFFKRNYQSLVYFTLINTWQRLVSSLLFRNQFFGLAVNNLLSLWLVLKILVITTWFFVWLVNYIWFSWTIVGFFILTK